MRWFGVGVVVVAVVVVAIATWVTVVLILVSMAGVNDGHVPIGLFQIIEVSMAFSLFNSSSIE